MYQYSIYFNLGHINKKMSMTLNPFMILNGVYEITTAHKKLVSEYSVNATKSKT